MPPPEVVVVVEGGAVVGVVVGGLVGGVVVGGDVGGVVVGGVVDPVTGGCVVPVPEPLPEDPEPPPDVLVGVVGLVGDLVVDDDGLVVVDVDVDAPDAVDPVVGVVGVLVETSWGTLSGWAGFTTHHVPKLSVTLPVTWPRVLSPTKV
jgi:hypothetical protein